MSEHLAAVIFDLDGLLVDSEPIWRAVEQQVFGEVGVRLTEEDTLSTTGLRVDEVVGHWMAARPWAGPGIAEVTSRIIEEMVWRLRATVRPLPGVDHALSVAGALGVPLAVASSSPMPVVDAALDRLGRRDAFRIIRSAEGLPKGKPDPAIYLLTATDLGVAPGSCTAVEDSPNGARAAKAAGMRCVAVPTADHRQAMSGIADVVLGSLTELRASHLTA